MALTAMNAGVNVICEKPIEITLERIDKMIETADAAHCMFISNPEGVLEALRGL